MAILRLYESNPATAASSILSIDAAMTNPDDESALTGTPGQVSVGGLYAAPWRSALDGGIDDEETAVTLSEAFHADTDHPVIICGTEKLLVTAGFGTKDITVTRGYDSTTAAEHSDAAKVYACYDFADIKIDCNDNSGTDESSWMLYRDYGTGDYEAPHSIADIDYNESVRIQRQLTVPASTSAQIKYDLEHVLTCSPTEHEV